MAPWLLELTLFDDPAPRSAALNMALDEVLLAESAAPILRIYRWAAPAVSFGYFESWAPVRASYPDRDPVRRWTGGGVVPHGEDYTYSLLVPRRAAAVSAAASYEVIHRALSVALGELGMEAVTLACASAGTSHACFEKPVAHDVMLRGRKIAGAAQRRSRAGLLHQGSIQVPDLPQSFAGRFASRLASRVAAGRYDLDALAQQVAEEKYGTEAWLRRVP